MKKIFISACAVFLLSGSFCIAKNAEWTFAMYMEAGGTTPDFYYWLFNNMNDMALAHSESKDVNIVMQVHVEKDEAWRYIVRHNAIKPIEKVSFSLDCGQNIVGFMKNTVKRYPANHYGLILWGHGFGVLDPTYRPTGENSFDWDVEADQPGLGCVGGICPLKGVDIYLGEQQVQDCLRCCPQRDLRVRGLMFNGAQSFLNNTSMVCTLKTIKETVLNGKKLDILGTDCCKMAMLEVGYQLKDSVNYLVGSQNCELVDGWNYKGFFSSFSGKEPLSPLGAVQAIVKAYDNYYKEHTVQNTYTLAALDLSQIDPLIENINNIVTLGKKLMLENKSIFKTILLNARTKSPSMCQASYYLDFGSVYTKLLEELSTPEAQALNGEDVLALKNLLTRGLDLIKPIIVAKSLGSAVDKFCGMSMYFPRNHIENSYFDTPFAQETLWLSFLQEAIFL